jgi:hypothetical protein
MRVGPAEQRGGAVALRAEALFSLYLFSFFFASSVSSRKAGTKKNKRS